MARKCKWVCDNGPCEKVCKAILTEPEKWQKTDAVKPKARQQQLGSPTSSTTTAIETKSAETTTKAATVSPFIDHFIENWWIYGITFLVLVLVVLVCVTFRKKIGNYAQSWFTRNGRAARKALIKNKNSDETDSMNEQNTRDAQAFINNNNFNENTLNSNIKV
jgi:Sec-independent protein translocase protein TatA